VAFGTGFGIGDSTDVTEDAIVILLALDSGLHLTSSQMEEWYDKLRNRGTTLSKMYHEKDFEVMVDETKVINIKVRTLYHYIYMTLVQQMKTIGPS
jgi:hypothetical protein